jgi:hypothetical protein
MKIKRWDELIWNIHGLIKFNRFVLSFSPHRPHPVLIRVINFVIWLYLILLIDIQIFYAIEVNYSAGSTHSAQNLYQ